MENYISKLRQKKSEPSYISKLRGFGVKKEEPKKEPEKEPEVKNETNPNELRDDILALKKEGYSLKEIKETIDSIDEVKDKESAKGIVDEIFGKKVKAGFVLNLEEKTKENGNFREVIFTATHCQLVLQSLKPSEDVGEETHDVDQFFRIEEGNGKVVLNGVESEIKGGFAAVVPAGTKHNIIAGESGLKFYTIYSPPEHPDKEIQETKVEKK